MKEKSVCSYFYEKNRQLKILEHSILAMEAHY